MARGRPFPRSRAYRVFPSAHTQPILIPCDSPDAGRTSLRSVVVTTKALTVFARQRNQRGETESDGPAPLTESPAGRRHNLYGHEPAARPLPDLLCSGIRRVAGRFPPQVRPVGRASGGRLSNSPASHPAPGRDRTRGSRPISGGFPGREARGSCALRPIRSPPKRAARHVPVDGAIVPCRHWRNRRLRCLNSVRARQPFPWAARAALGALGALHL